MRSLVLVVCCAVGVAACARTAEAGLFSTVFRVDRYLAGFKKTSDASGAEAFARPGWQYEKVGERGDLYQLRMIRKSGRFKKSSPQTGEVEAGEIYEIKKSLIDEDPLARVLVQAFDTGIFAVPLKYRPKVANGPSALSGSGSLGAAFAWRAKTDLSTTEVAPLVFVGLSQVPLQDDDESAAKETGALTVAVGLQVDVLGRTSLGLVSGWDWIPGTLGVDWPYRGKAWFSVGINFTFFNRESPQKQ